MVQKRRKWNLWGSTPPYKNEKCLAHKVFPTGHTWKLLRRWVWLIISLLSRYDSYKFHFNYNFYLYFHEKYSRIDDSKDGFGLTHYRHHSSLDLEFKCDRISIQRLCNTAHVNYCQNAAVKLTITATLDASRATSPVFIILRPRLYLSFLNYNKL